VSVAAAEVGAVVVVVVVAADEAVLVVALVRATNVYNYKTHMVLIK